MRARGRSLVATQDVGVGVMQKLVHRFSHDGRENSTFESSRFCRSRIPAMMELWQPLVAGRVSVAHS